MKAAEKLWNYEDYLKLEGEKRYEIIDGELVEMPAPGVRHQEILKRLARHFETVEKRGIGLYYFSPIDLVLSEKDVFQPDLVVVLKENYSIIQDRGIFGAPDLVVEVISPSTFKKDTEEKRELYAKSGVKEYWLVIPELKIIEVLTLRSGKYEVHSFACESGKVCSRLLEDLCIELEELFR
ncbi:MAG: Uma2 family endonuclease [Aquificaceae bacterium]|jgi:Uma2 family endonuclease|uniref:Uma2 family endonuclease n=1 Tax=Hydrogenobacter sp. Uz 6-8 TaxID=3384828 RepID=UPI000F0D81E5|nr:MAG: Uma2 family endonuclease [Aquificota bacterium]